MSKNPKALLLCALPSPLKIENGLLSFQTQCLWEGRTVSLSLEGEYLSKEKILGGTLIFSNSYTTKQYKEGERSYYARQTCDFSSTTIDKDIDTIQLSTNNCTETSNYTGEKTTRATSDIGLGEYRLANWQSEEINENKLEDSRIRFSDIVGEVDILLPTGYNNEGEPIFDDEEGWNYAKLDMELPYGAKIRLKERSAILLSMPDMTTYQLVTPENLFPYDNTVVMLPLKPKGDNILKLLGGQLYNNLKQMIKDGSMDIEMGQAVAGIKGTIFVLEEDGKTSKLKVLEGEVNLKSKVNRESQMIRAGESIVANADGLSQKTTFDINAEKENWNFIDRIERKNKKEEYRFFGNLGVKMLLGVALVIAMILVYISVKKIFGKKENI